LANLCHGEYSKCPSVSNAGMETSAPLINAIVNNALFHSNPYINQMPPQIVYSLCFSLRDLLRRRGWLAGWLGVRHTPVLYQNG